jgi:D-glycerate 3-kinase
MPWCWRRSNLEPDPAAGAAEGEAAQGRLDPVLRRGFVEPLLLQLAAWADQARRGERRRPLLGLQGPVGAGKSTLGRQLEALAPAYGLRLVVASIDDLYCSWPERRERLAGNPFGVSRVPPGSHDIPLLLAALQRWRAGEELVLPRFDKRLEAGQGDRCGWRRQACDALVLEGWLLGCRPLPEARLQRLLEQAGILAGLGEGPPRAGEREEQRRSAEPGASDDPIRPAAAGDRGSGAPPLRPAEWAWLPRWNQELQAYLPLWDALDGLWILRPQHWGLPRRWRFQAEARQRSHGGGWLPAEQLDALVRASLCSLPPALYLDPLLPAWALCTQGNAPAATDSTAAAAARASTPAPGTETDAAAWMDRAATVDPVMAARWADGSVAPGSSCPPAGEGSGRSAEAAGSRGGSRPDGQEAGDVGPGAVGRAAAAGNTAAAAARASTPAPGTETDAAAWMDRAAAGWARPAPPTPLAAQWPGDHPAGQGTVGRRLARALISAADNSQPQHHPEGPVVQAIAVLDGRRRCLATLTQSSSDSASSATG